MLSSRSLKCSKIIMSLLIAALSASLPALSDALPSVEQADATISGYLKAIRQEKDHQVDAKNNDTADANDQLIDYLEKAAQNPLFLTVPLVAAGKNGLNVVSSPDGKLRIYNWDSWTGGTMSFFYAVVQYQANDGKDTKALVLYPAQQAAGAVQGSPDPGWWYDSVKAVHTADGKTVYIAFGTGKYSTIDFGVCAQAFTVESGKLVKAPLFQDGAITTDAITRTFHHSPDDADVPSAIEIDLSEDGKRIEVPVVTAEGKATAGFRFYDFDGQKFVHRSHKHPQAAGAPTDTTSGAPH